MRLSDLEPAWYRPIRFYNNDVRFGITFLCPLCKRRRLAANFKNVIDPLNVMPSTTWKTPHPAWEREGETFDTLTLLPSIDYSASGHWHGSIIKGEIHTAGSAACAVENNP